MTIDDVEDHPQMYPPPELKILSKLKVSPLESISFGSYVAHLAFENGNMLTISAPFRFSTEQQITSSDVHEFPLKETGLVRLLGLKAVGLTCDEDGTLDLTFENSDRLIVYANDPSYEAYTVSIDGREYIV